MKNNEKELLLVVDDDRLVLATLVSGLRSAGFDVIEAENGEDAILLAREHTPQLALLDIRMSGMTGLDVARYLASQTEIPFMFLSAFGDPEIVQEASSYGAMGFLVKPLDVKQVVPAVKSALARSKEMKRLRQSAAVLADTLVHGKGHETLIAAGILVERYRVNCDQALEMLRRQARAERRKVEEVAIEIVEAAERLNVAGSFASAVPPVKS